MYVTGNTCTLHFLHMCTGSCNNQVCTYMLPHYPLPLFSSAPPLSLPYLPLLPPLPPISPPSLPPLPLSPPSLPPSLPQVVVPVCATCAQALGTVVRTMEEERVGRVVEVLLSLSAQQEWEVRHASLMGIQHLLAARTVSGSVLN